MIRRFYMSKSKQYIIILAIGMIIIGSLIFFNLNNSTKTFSKNNISFGYPGSWQDYTEKANIKKQLKLTLKQIKHIPVFT